jgi:signal peptidase II
LRRRSIRWAILAVTVLLVLALDQGTKALVVRNLAANRAWAPFPALERIFTFTHVQNTGIAFGQFQGLGFLFSIVQLLVALAIPVYYAQLPYAPLSMAVALGMVQGGALGNLIDRFRTGLVNFQTSGDLLDSIQRAYVTDFLNFKVWPVFNVADLCVVSGVCILVYLLWRAEREAARAPASDEPSS